jgi:hypothetical protein
MKKTIIALGVVGVLIVGLAGGYFWGYARGGAAITASYATKIAAVNKLFPTPTSIFSLTGTVQSVNGSVVTISVAPLLLNPFADTSFPTTREITIAASTTITQMTQKDPAAYQQEVQAYMKQTATHTTTTTTTALAGPLPYTETNIDVSDIKVGDTVTVGASSNIMSAASFTATTIQDQMQTQVPPPVTP